MRDSLARLWSFGPFCVRCRRRALFSIRAPVLGGTLIVSHVPLGAEGRLTGSAGEGFLSRATALTQRHIGTTGHLGFVLRVRVRPPASKLVRTFLPRKQPLPSLRSVRNALTFSGRILLFCLWDGVLICVWRDEAKQTTWRVRNVMITSSNKVKLIFRIFHSRFSLTVQPSSSSLMTTRISGVSHVQTSVFESRWRGFRSS